MNTQDLITKSMVDHDTIQAIEDTLGRPLNHSSQVENMVVLGTAIRDNEAKNAWLQHVGDTTLSMDWAEYFLFISNLGFKLVKSFSLYKPDIGRDRHDDVYFFVREDGLLLVADTFTYESEGKIVSHRNGATLYFALKPKTEDVKFLHGVSGGWESESEPKWRHTYTEGKPADCLLVGNLDAREALAYNLRRITQGFEPMNKWPKQPMARGSYLNFVVGQDWPAHEFRAFSTHSAESAYIENLGRSRYLELPQEVQDMINLEV